MGQDSASRSLVEASANQTKGFQLSKSRIGIPCDLQSNSEKTDKSMLYEENVRERKSGLATQVEIRPEETAKDSG